MVIFPRNPVGKGGKSKNADGRNDPFVSPLKDPDVQKAEFLPLDQYVTDVWKTAMVITALCPSAGLPDDLETWPTIDLRANHRAN